jgi:hypothetical protein
LPDEVSGIFFATGLDQELDTRLIPTGNGYVCFDAFSSREPVRTSLENALSRPPQIIRERAIRQCFG